LRQELGDDNLLSSSIDLTTHSVIVDPGSLGQPRNFEKASSIMQASSSANILEVELSRLEYDVAAHKRDISSSSMSDKTKHKLLSYFR
jgi:hypothetical protein